MSATLNSIIKRSAKKNAHGMVANLIRQFLERGELDEEDQEDIYEYEALKEIQRYHDKLC
jgi:hypothetical protein